MASMEILINFELLIDLKEQPFLKTCLHLFKYSYIITLERLIKAHTYIHTKALFPISNITSNY